MISAKKLEDNFVNIIIMFFGVFLIVLTIVLSNLPSSHETGLKNMKEHARAWAEFKDTCASTGGVASRYGDDRGVFQFSCLYDDGAIVFSTDRT